MRRQADARASASTFLAATFALLLTASGSAQLSVSQSPIGSRAADSHHIEQTWTLSAPSADPAATLDALSISLPGATFVSFDPSATLAPNAVAILRVVSDSPSEFSSLSVSAQKRSDGWQQISVQAGMKLADAVVEIVLTQPNQLQLLRVSGHGDVVIGDKVLFGWISTLGAAQSGIDVSGYASVFLQLTEPLEGGHVALNVSGQADLQIETPSLQFNSLSVVNSGASSEIKLFANSVDCATTSFTLTESGDVCWSIQHFQMATLAVSLSGSGSIAGLGGGSCNTEKVSISGSGDATIDSINCLQVQVNLSGSGDAVVQASEYLSGVVSGSGDVSYTGQKPRYMSDKHGLVATSSTTPAKKIASPAASTQSKTCKKREVPTNKLKSHNAAAGSFPPPLKYGDSDSKAHWDTPRSGGDSTSLNKIWGYLGANLYVVIPVGVFVAFWAIVLTLSRRANQRRLSVARRQDPEQRALLRSGGNDADPPVYI